MRRPLRRATSACIVNVGKSRSSCRQDSCGDGRLAIAKLLHALELVRPVGIVHRKRKKFNRAAQSFLELLQEVPERAEALEPVGR